MRQLAARDGAVHAVVIGRDAARCGEGGLAPGPQPEPVRFVLRGAQRDCAAAREYRLHLGDLFRDFFRRAVRLAQQDGFGFERVTGMHEILHRPGHESVHHFQSGRDDAGGDDLAHGGTRFCHGAERGHHHARQFGFGQQLDRHLGDHAQHAFAAGEQGQQVVAGAIQRFRAELQQFAVHGIGAHLEHVVHGEAVFQAVHAARVFRHVAADGAGDLAGRVGRVVQAMRRGRIGDRQIAHAGLDAGDARNGIERQYAS